LRLFLDYRKLLVITNWWLPKCAPSAKRHARGGLRTKSREIFSLGRNYALLLFFQLAPSLAGTAVRNLEDSTFLVLVIVVSLASAWILWPFFGAMLWAAVRY
jgi:hypothetical protein